MLAFVIPLRPKNGSKDWPKEEKLLERTIKSILNQRSSEFLIFVVYTDLPHINVTSPSLKLLHFPYPFLRYSEIVDTHPSSNRSKSWLENNMDKGRKIMFGCRVAKEQGCQYIMQVDSDDLLNNKLAAFVNKNLFLNKPGWYVNKGFIYTEGKNYILRQPDNMNLLNGSTHIIRKDLIPTPDFTSNRTFDYFFFCAHGYLKSRIKTDFKEELEPLPFYGNVYIVSGNNQSLISEHMRVTNLKSFIKFLLRCIPLTSGTKRAFGLYRL